MSDIDQVAVNRRLAIYAARCPRHGEEGTVVDGNMHYCPACGYGVMLENKNYIDDHDWIMDAMDEICVAQNLRWTTMMIGRKMVIAKVFSTTNEDSAWKAIEIEDDADSYLISDTCWLALTLLAVGLLPKK